ncbi:hypothetical protein MLD38_016199 [Melastoma candidum]|uniref:Uncharacterized protein n=1 Tax=Melastoma candidum TaxID=119954 RepID=A0ACB9RIE3_9MYRT|nr:hypothetical protein MLD38_016199 [Melastoma candidum]
METETETESDVCAAASGLLSTFVDAFVDFSVSGVFLPNPNPKPSPSPSPSPIPQHRFPSPFEGHRLVAIGDLHGDLPKALQSLALSGLVDPSSGRWAGGSSTLVQVGDVLDRGDRELCLLYSLEKLRREAAAAGGSVLTLNGNHEIMNVEGDFRFVTRGGLEEFKNWAYWYQVGISMKLLCKELKKDDTTRDIFYGIPESFPGVKEEFYEGFRARIAALRPDGPITTRFLSRNLTVLVHGESVFVHGGLLGELVSTYGLERMNEEVREWMMGKQVRNDDSKSRFLAPGFVRGRDSLVWLRKFSEENADKCDCSALEHALATIPGAKRMIMGHTIQTSGINEACGNKAIRIDVGMSKGCIDGLPEVLEIIGDSKIRVLTSNPLYQDMGHRNYGKGEKKKKSGLGILLPGAEGPNQVEVRA